MKDGLLTLAGTALVALKAFAYIAVPALMAALIVTVMLSRFLS